MARPPKYTAEKLAEACSDYFATIPEEKMPTKSGILISLNICRDTWNEYRKKPEFSDTIKDAEKLIEDAWVQRLSGSAVTGAIFYLKNAFKEHYRDSHDVTSDGKALQVAFDPAFKDAAA